MCAGRMRRGQRADGAVVVVHFHQAWRWIVLRRHHHCRLLGRPGAVGWWRRGKGRCRFLVNVNHTLDETLHVVIGAHDNDGYDDGCHGDQETDRDDDDVDGVCFLRGRVCGC